MVSCQQKVIELLQDKVLVGHGLANDLQVLGITNMLPWYMIRDTALYEPYMKTKQYVPVDGTTGIVGSTYLCPRKLKDLCSEHLQREIQVVGQSHSSYEDAVAALDLYKLVQSKWECSIRFQLMKTAVQMEEEQYKLQKYQQKLQQKKEQQKKQQQQQKKNKKQQQLQLQQQNEQAPNNTKPSKSNKQKQQQQKKKQQGKNFSSNKNVQRQGSVELYHYQQQQQYYYMQQHSVAMTIQ